MRDITLCHPRLQSLAARWIQACAAQGISVAIAETLRTAAEQDTLYAQGRTQPGSIVTNAKGSEYKSQHQWGIAFDFYLVMDVDGDGKTADDAYNDRTGLFGRAAAIGKELGLAWGGDWTSIIDKPHLYLPDWGSTPTPLIRTYGTPEAFMRTWIQPEGWVRDGIGYWYRRADGSYPANQWCVINHHWYLFNRDGYMVTGWHRWDGKVCDPDDGSGDWYFLDNTAGGPLEGACWHERADYKGAWEIWYVDQENQL